MKGPNLHLLKQVCEATRTPVIASGGVSRLEDLHKLADGSMVVRSRIDLRKLSSALKIAWDPEIEATTAGGLVTNELERIPRVGDAVVWQGHRIEVLRADERRATLLRIEKLQPGTANDGASTRH